MDIMNNDEYYKLTKEEKDASNKKFFNEYEKLKNKLEREHEAYISKLKSNYEKSEREREQKRAEFMSQPGIVKISLPKFRGQKKDLEKITAYDTSSLKNHDKDIFQDASIDISYFKEQLDFINSLTTRERSILSAYTYEGDRVINGLLRKTYTGKDLYEYMRKTLYIPWREDVRESNYIELANEYLKEFSDIFKRVPVLKTRMRVFRAFRPEEDWKSLGFYSKATSPSQEYMSTTYATGDDSLGVGGFMNKKKNIKKSCCLMELILEPGIRALWIQPISRYQHEHEIIIEKGVAMYKGCILEKTYPLTIDILSNNSDNENGAEYEDHPFDITVYEYNIKPYKHWMSKLGEVLYKEGLKCFTRKKVGGKRVNPFRFPPRFSKAYCRKKSCKKMGFTEKASCRPYKNCYTRKARR